MRRISPAIPKAPKGKLPYIKDGECGDRGFRPSSASTSSGPTGSISIPATIYSSGRWPGRSSACWRIIWAGPPQISLARSGEFREGPGAFLRRRAGSHPREAEGRTRWRKCGSGYMATASAGIRRRISSSSARARSTRFSAARRQALSAGRYAVRRRCHAPSACWRTVMTPFFETDLRKAARRPASNLRPVCRRGCMARYYPDYGAAAGRMTHRLDALGRVSSSVQTLKPASWFFAEGVGERHVGRISAARDEDAADPQPRCCADRTYTSARPDRPPSTRRDPSAHKAAAGRYR